jgi:hypothetical protein
MDFWVNKSLSMMWRVAICHRIPISAKYRAISQWVESIAKVQNNPKNSKKF